MSKPTIYIAAGHGGSDPGAVNGKYIEKALTLKTALACQNYLRNYECETVMARTTDKSCTVAYKMEEVEKKQPSLVLEIHYNAGGGEGCEVYYWHTHAPSKSLAQKVLAEMVKLGQKSRGIKESKAGTSYNFGMCRQAATTGIPSILGEYAFVDNAKDQAKINSDAKLRAVGEAYAKAAIVYLGLKKKAEPPKPSPGGGSGVITVGSTVKVSGAKYATGQTIPGWVKSTTHKVSEINGDRALLGRDGGICSWVYLRDLTLVSGGAAKPVEVGRQVTINKGAVYGGLTSARGSKVPAAQLAPKKHTVSKIQANKGVREALLKEITSWVAVSSLTRV
ncbi:MAG: N-acetylmuramoyl-L-alanine amidase family protein [Acutalibacteraceae bacterium]